MGRIYQQAQLVIVWLTLDNCDNSHGSASLSPTRKYRKVTADDIATLFTYLKFAAQHMGNECVQQEYKRSFGDDIEMIYDILDMLFRLPYWSRVWIVQEFVLAKDLVFRCDSEEIPWHILNVMTHRPEPLWFCVHYDELRSRMRQTTADVWQAIYWENDSLCSSRSQCWTQRGNFGVDRSLIYSLQHERDARLDLYEIVYRPEQSRLSDLIIRHMKKNCQDPRDKVYAYLAIAALNEHTVMLSADYSISAEELFFNVVELICADIEHLQRNGEKFGQLGNIIRSLATAFALPWQMWSGTDLKEEGSFDISHQCNLRARCIGPVGNIVQECPWKPRGEIRSTVCRFFYVGPDEGPDNMTSEFIGHIDVHKGDKVFQFEGMRIGFVAKDPDWLSAGDKLLHVFSKVWEVPFSRPWRMNIPLCESSWQPTGLSVTRDNGSTPGSTVVVKVTRKQLIGLMNDEILWLAPKSHRSGENVSAIIQSLYP